MFTVPNSLNVVPSPLKRLPSITAFGTRFPPKFAYPSQLDRYKPFSMPTLQTRPSATACAVAGVLGAITATRQTNAQAKAKELIMIFVKFVFIVIVSFCLCFIVLAILTPRHRVIICGRSLEYSVGFGASLRRKFARQRIRRMRIPSFLVVSRAANYANRR